MKKIAVVFDGLRFSESALQYAISLAKKDPAHISALFLDDYTYNSFNMYQLMRDGATEKEIIGFEARDRNKRETLGQYVASALEKEGITSSIHHSGNIAIQDVLHESVYTDLLIVDMHETFIQEKTPPPTRFIKDLLMDAQCPVLVVPGEYQEIDRSVLLYNGAPSSVYAIKMADYLMPWMGELPVELLSVNDTYGDKQLKDSPMIKEFTEKHFPAATYNILYGQPETHIIDELKEQAAGTMVILGAYRKGSLSRWLRMSMADMLMGNLQLPLFIAHNK
jgi:nucleotide-binding universal stress UspA family protein